MMSISISRKSKINLTDYAYRRDIENRLLMAQLSVFEVDVLKEILHHSLHISISHLAEVLQADLKSVDKALDKLSATHLFKRSQSALVVDKEMRKYYESQIEKFDEDFEPNMEFLQGLLNKIPIHILPVWYAIPRNSDNIFASIIEKYFLTPKIYRQYLDELQFDDPILHHIVKDLYQAPNFKLVSSTLIEKYGLTREKFEEYLLLLEYNFVCCLSYNKVQDQWQEVITPFYEWLEYLQAEARSKPHPIKDKNQIELLCPMEFGFIADMQAVLRTCSSKKLTLKEAHAVCEDNRPKKYREQLIEKLAQVDFIKLAKNSIHVTDKGALWLTKSTIEQAIALANDSLNILKSFGPPPSPLHTFRHVQQVEKGLRKLIDREWIDLDEFLKGFITPIGNKEPVTLVNKGKRWKYQVPTYNKEECAFIQQVIEERLFELGIVAIGTYQGRTCFCLTPFGRLSIS